MRILEFIKVVYDEMLVGNFSFPIFVVGVAQFAVMIVNIAVTLRKNKSNTKKMRV